MTKMKYLKDKTSGMRKISLILFVVLIFSAVFVSATPKFYSTSQDTLVKITDKIKVSLVDSDSMNKVAKGIAVNKKGNEYSYKNVLSNTDIKYTVYPNEIKEEIILKQKPDFDKIKFFIDLSDEEYEFNNFTNEIYIYHSKDMHIAKGIFYAPFYIYNNKKVYLDVSFDNGNYEIDLSPIKELSSSYFPLVIDPAYGDVTSCSENDTHVNCAGTVTGTYIDTNKNILFESVIWSYNPGDCNSASIAITTNKTFFAYDSSISASGGDCWNGGKSGSVSINANNTEMYDLSVHSGGGQGDNRNDAGGSTTSTVTISNYAYLNYVQISSSGGYGRGDNYCGASGSGGSGTSTLYGRYIVATNGTQISGQGGSCGYSPCDGGSGYAQIYRTGSYNGSYLNVTDSTILHSSSGGIGCSSRDATNHIKDFQTIITNQTTFSASPNRYTYHIIEGAETVIFHNKTTFAGSNYHISAGRNITLNGTNARIALFDPSVTGNLKMSIKALDDTNITVGILESGDDTENVTISGDYHTVNYWAFFNPDYQNISVVDNTLNCTSLVGGMCGYNGTHYSDCLADDETPDFVFQTHNPAACKLWNESKNWTTLDNQGVADCSNTGGTDHTCSFPEALLDGMHHIYIACKSGNYEINDFIANPSNHFNGTVRKDQSAKDAIQQAISTSLTGYTVYDNKPVYIRSLNNSQAFTVFDKVVAYANKRWAFKYRSIGESPPLGTFYNMSPVFYFLEMINMTTAEITDNVGELINSTKV